MRPAPLSMKMLAKKATNLPLLVLAYQAAKSSDINNSRDCEERLREEIRLRMAHLWNVEYADFLAAYNRRVEREGLALEGWRAF